VTGWTGRGAAAGNIEAAVLHLRHEFDRYVGGRAAYLEKITPDAEKVFDVLQLNGDVCSCSNASTSVNGDCALTLT
jgi:hypothetical protein